MPALHRVREMEDSGGGRAEGDFERIAGAARGGEGSWWKIAASSARLHRIGAESY